MGKEEFLGHPIKKRGWLIVSQPLPGQPARGSKMYAVKCAPVRGAEPDDTGWERLRFPDHAMWVGRFYLPSGGVPALPRLLFLFDRPT